MGKKKKGGGFLVQGTILAAAGIITKIIGAVYRIPMLNIMGLEGQGYYEIAFQIYSIALIISSYSLPLAVSKLVSARVGKKQRRNAYRIFKAAMIFAVGVGTTISLIIFFGADAIAKYLMESEASAYALKVLAPGLLIVAVMGVLRGYFQGLGTMVPTAISQVLEQILNAIVSVVGAAVLMDRGKMLALQKGNATLGPAYSAAGGTLGTVIGALIGLVFLFACYYAYRGTLKRQIRSDRTRRLEDYSYIFKVMLLTIAPVILSSTVYNIGNIIGSTMFNKIMAAQGMSADARAVELGKLGQYYTLFNVPIAVANSLGASMMPALVRAYETRDRKLMYNRIYMAVRYVMLIMIPSAFGFFALGKPLMDFIWPNVENTTQGHLMQLGAVSLVLYALSTVTNAVLQGLDRMMKPVKNAAIGQVIHTIVAFLSLVIFKWGVFSLIMAKIAFAAVVCIMNAHDIYEAIGYRQEKQKTFAVPCIAGLIMAAATFGVHFVLDIFIGGRVATLLAIAVAVIVYAICVLKFGGLTEDEILGLPKGATLLQLFKRLHLVDARNY